MSTLTSSEMNFGGRSSTRRHAPPGGQSSFSVSWGNAEPDIVKIHGGKVVSIPSPMKAPKEVAPSVGEDEVSLQGINLEEVLPAEPASVGLVVVRGNASEHAHACAAKALAQAGLTRVVPVEVAYSSMLVGAAQKLLNTPGIAGVLAVFVAPPQQAAAAAGQEAALFQLGTLSAKPVIPGVVCQASLLEANAVVAALAGEWAGALAGLLLQDFAGLQPQEPVEVVPLAPEADELDPVALLDIYRECLKSHGASGIFGLARKFRIIDDDNSRSIDLSEFCKAIAEASLSWSQEQKQALFRHFDRDGSGAVSFDEFLGTVRGELNERRKQFVLMAFELLDADKSGTIEVRDISAKYDASKHPDVISGTRGPEEVLREFLDTFDGTEKDGKVTFAEFCAYYSNVSASIDDDDYFELMMRNAWHISGGEGWCANTSNRRVLVTHTDGRQTVQEIKNDLGVGESDEGALLANLAAQGISDVQSVEFNSGKKLQASAPVPAPAPAPTATVNTESAGKASNGAPPTPSKGGRHGHNASGAASIVLG